MCVAGVVDCLWVFVAVFSGHEGTKALRFRKEFKVNFKVPVDLNFCFEFRLKPI